MQADDRAEIEDNDLAQATMSIVDRIRPHLATIAAAIGVLLAASLGWTLYSGQKVSEQEQAWDACLAALTSGDAARLQDVANRHAGSSAGTWARLLLADGALADGCRRAFTEKERGREQFQVAIDGYTAILAQKPGGIAAERAAFGLAKAREALGQLDLAKKGYEAVAAEHGGGPLKELAKILLAPPAEEGKGAFPCANAIAAIGRLDWDAACAALLELLERDRHYGYDLAAKALKQIFLLLGPRDAITTRHQPRFASLLFS
jgi:predicted negative regulator of RcsB-dependent stress response